METIEGRAFIDGRLKDARITIKDGTIDSIGKPIGKVDDGKIILPGFVDPHVHFRDPGLTDKEDFRSGSLSALFAGVTCVLDMPNTIPNTTDAQALTDKIDGISSRSYTDFGIFAGLTPDCNVLEMADAAVGFKLFMGSTTGGMLMNNDPEIRSKFADVRKTGKTVSVHAEDNSLISVNDETDNHDHMENRPADAELSAIRRLSEYEGMRINICHVSTAHGAKVAKMYGFTTEVTLNHLLLNSDHEGTMYKVNPPLRSEFERSALYEVFEKGTISMFGTDHAPHTVDDKSQPYRNAPSGIASVEVAMPIIMQMVGSGRIPLEMAVDMGSTIPARTFNLNKGMIAEGYDADLSVFDMNNVTKVHERELHGKVKRSVYNRYDAIFPEMVMVRGNVQICDGGLSGRTLGEDVIGN